jgi:23S rRNA G2069 N7-methylase RlmK/C1962 C5-methylase RlmI
METKTISQAEMLANRLKKRLQHLNKWAKRTGIEAFRLYDRDIPEIPLVLDKYGDVISGALYKRPYEKDDEEESRWLAAMADATALATGIKHENIIIKQRERQTGSPDGDSRRSQYEKMAEKNIIREVSEGKLKFKVNLSDYLDTGLFLDRRAMRRAFGDDSNGKRVLNLFCYTASFSIYAADGTAASVDSVDLSNTYLNWARDNFALNGFDVQKLQVQEFFSGRFTRTCAHTLIRSDVITFLHKAASTRLRWDSIILDPPAFSNSKMTHNDFDLRRDHEELLANCLTLLNPSGVLWFSAAARSFKTSAEKLETALKERFPAITVTDITGKITDEEFNNKKMPMGIQIRN